MKLQLKFLPVNLSGLGNKLLIYKVVELRCEAMHANTLVANGMKGANKVMEAMNKQMALAKQMKSEMMSESLDNVLDDDEVEEETEELTNQILLVQK
ncbi:vacuolar protein sorting-associated protein 2 homolog 2-like [Magnolia sinica]|uniref:vacuolar protein sorting-associated protein 2 homolog 2-like n=1 Tax=Magnolia sinica TaxID=86752 RepID=UPI002658E599|nr:vacuolar protein sorting-associated protein 2 homolog 2-like [Magnolia sinica]